MGRRILWAWLLLGLPLPALADGFIVPIPPPRPVLPRRPLSIVYHKVDIKVRDGVVRVEIDQKFRNETPYRIEGYYIFPIPPEAVVSQFSMFVDGKEWEAELLPKDEALRIYESIVRRLRDPAILEYMGRSTLRARIAPIPPHGTRRITLTYEQVLKRDGNLFKLVYPLDTERFSAKPLP